MTFAAIPRTERRRLRRERRRAAVLGVAVLAVALVVTVLILSGGPVGAHGPVPGHVHAVSGHTVQPAHLAPVGARVP
jgi:hypothetical protein